MHVMLDEIPLVRSTADPDPITLAIPITRLPVAVDDGLQGDSRKASIPLADRACVHRMLWGLDVRSDALYSDFSAKSRIV
jgi:hypothetical protein